METMKLILPIVFALCAIVPANAGEKKLYPTVLVCPGAILPQECQGPNALSVISSIEPSTNPIMCLMYAQEQLAKTAVVHSGEFLKVMCEARG
jgi:hypothetical protein